jgi:hypothetical protein
LQAQAILENLFNPFFNLSLSLLQAQAILENLVRSEPSIKANLLGALVEASVSEKQVNRF